MKQLDEKEIIRIFSQALGVADDLDDVATVAVGSRNLVFKADMLVASTDVPPQMSPQQVARKSVAACASDLAAKGARPVAAMIALGLPAEITRAYVEGLATGFQAASREFDVKIVGGDTNAARDLVIDCSMIGAAGKRVPRRDGAKPGDAVVVSGKFGYSASGLAILLKGARAQGGFRKAAVDSALEPRPRQAFGTALARYFSSSIDSSDGLAVSLYEIATRSNVDIAADPDAASAAGVREFAGANGLDVHELVFHGGEEYEIVATVPKSLLPKAKAAAKKAGCDLYVIGSVEKGTGKVTAGKHLLENRGYLHFG
ncbi:MAG: thiamine-phosphate kinase [Nitrososphaera sp.]